MKKFVPTLIIAACLFTATSHTGNAKSLDQKIDIAKTQLDAKQQKLNINTATNEELESLPGIGKKKASNIVAYRKVHGDFSSVQELANVKGIGVKMVEKIKDSISTR